MSIQPGVHPVVRDDVPRLVEVWEASVRATHDFISEADIQLFRSEVRDHLFGSMELACVRDEEGALAAFLGVADGKLEALFVDPAWRGTGIGRRLVRHAVDTLGATTVDVNEQNGQAVGFYLRMGFEVEGRSELDSMGKPFPLLHMRLRPADGPGAAGASNGPRGADRSAD
jgi:putative acetyltransferase